MKNVFETIANLIATIICNLCDAPIMLNTESELGEIGPYVPVDYSYEATFEEKMYAIEHGEIREAAMFYSPRLKSMFCSKEDFKNIWRFSDKHHRFVELYCPKGYNFVEYTVVDGEEPLRPFDDMYEIEIVHGFERFSFKYRTKWDAAMMFQEYTMYGSFLDSAIYAKTGKYEHIENFRMNLKDHDTLLYTLFVTDRNECGTIYD